MLKGKTVILGVSGSIAAYKIANLASMLVKQHCDVHVIMTENATNFITPITFETLTGNRCITDTFNRNFEFNVAHVSLAKKADIMLIAPATANVIGKLAAGIADDMLTTTALSCSLKKLIAPAMNTDMYNNTIVQENIAKLKNCGFTVISPASGRLACGDEGAGKMQDEAVLFEYILKEIAKPKDLTGVRLLVTAGPTREALDPVRFITNHSSGKMGYAIAKAAMLRGAEVTLVSGKTALAPPLFVNTVNVCSAKEMFDEVTAAFPNQDIIIKSAAVADYRPKYTANEKIKKGSDDSLILELERTDDILKHISRIKKPNQFVCGFSMETENLIQNSKNKLIKKNLDMIAANSLREKGSGFGTDTNRITIITKEAEIELEQMSKDETAHRLLDEIIKIWKG